MYEFEHNNYAFQIVNSNFTSSIYRWTDKQQIYTKSTTISDHYLQTIFDIDIATLVKHSSRFVILRHGFSLFIQHTEFFSRRLFQLGKCKRWRLRYYEYKNARWIKLSYEIHETFTTYEKKKKIISTESNVVKETRLERVLEMMMLKEKFSNSMNSMNHCITEKHHYSHIVV